MGKCRRASNGDDCGLTLSTIFLLAELNVKRGVAAIFFAIEEAGCGGPGCCAEGLMDDVDVMKRWGLGVYARSEQAFAIR